MATAELRLRMFGLFLVGLLPGCARDTPGLSASTDDDPSPPPAVSQANPSGQEGVNPVANSNKSAATGSDQPGDPPLDNGPLLDEVNQAELWFHAKKTRPIFARRLDKAKRVVTLEGDEDVPAGMYLCRGEAKDIWPQTPERLESKYVATDEVTPDGYRKYVPHPDNQGVMAAEIGKPFAVQAAWGRLSGKAGDFLVKNFEDRDNPQPADVWIVDHGLFAATYERVEK